MSRALGVVPGLLLCLAVALLAALLGELQVDFLGRAWLEPMVLAILLGMALGSAIRLPAAMEPGIRFSAKTLLDIAVVLLGATLSAAAVAALGLRVFLLVALVVAVGLGLAYALGRALGLTRRLSLLIAAGNAICGNSAIAAVAPVIGAKREEVAAAIALTALIGVVAVLALLVAVYIAGMALPDYAVLTGLTVYAVPQVVAATAAGLMLLLALSVLVLM